MKKNITSALTSSQIKDIINHDSQWKEYNQNSIILNVSAPVTAETLKDEDLCRIAISQHLFKNIVDKWAVNQDFVLKSSYEKITHTNVDSLVIVDDYNKDESVIFKVKITIGFTKNS